MFRKIALLASIGIMFFSALAFADAATSGITYNGVLLDSNGKPLHGYYDVKATLWSDPVVANGDLNPESNTYINTFASHFLDFIEDQQVVTDDQGRFSIKIGRFALLPAIAPAREVFLQLDVKPGGSDYQNWETMDFNSSTSQTDRIGVFSSELTHAISFDQNFGYYGGVLLDDQGAPLQGDYVARFSLWRSADVDTAFDFLSDSSLNTAASNYLGYTSEVPFQTNNQGAFSLPLGHFTPLDKALLEEDIFLQIEIKRADEYAKSYEIIDPDADMATGVDRFWCDLSGGALTLQEKTDGVLNTLGSDGKWIVNRIPGGTSSKTFELGVGNTDPFATLVIRANQGSDPQGILRYNGYTNRWEISNDGKSFQAINSMSDVLGTQNDTFTIGLNDDGETPLGLIFGESIGASLYFDPVRNVFRINRPLDFAQNELIGAVFQNLPSHPENPVAGQQYFNTTEKEMYYFDGTLWWSMGPPDYRYTTGGGGSSTVVNQLIDPGGTNYETFIINKDADVSNVNISLIAEQGTEPDGILRFNATTNVWEVSGDGGTTFEEIATTTGTQTLENKTIDGDNNTLVNIDFSSLKERIKTHTFEPSYGGVVYDKDGTDNKGVLSIDNDGTARKNYYMWRTSMPTAQDLDIVMEWKIPEDFVSFVPANPVEVDFRTSSTTLANSSIELFMKDSLDAAVTLTPIGEQASAAASTWRELVYTYTGTPTFTAGDLLTIRVRVKAAPGEEVDLGRVILTYYGR